MLQESLPHHTAKAILQNLCLDSLGNGLSLPPQGLPL
jgi:hypothetical protein